MSEAMKKLLFLALGIAVGIGGTALFRPVAKSVPPTESIEAPPTIAHEKETIPSRAIAEAPITREAPLENLRKAIASGDLHARIGAIRELAASDCAEAAEALRKLNSDDRRALWRAFSERWAALDPDAAIGAAMKLRDNDFRYLLGRAAALELVRRDIEGSVQRLEDAQGFTRLTLANWILPSIAKFDPVRATEYLKSNPSLLRAEYVSQEVVREYGAVAPEAALKWIETLPYRLRERLATFVWDPWAARDPAGAASMLSASGEQADTRGHRLVAAAWSQKDLSGTLAWIKTLPNERAQEAAYEGLRIPEAGSFTSDEALKLIESLESKSAQGNISMQFALRVARENPREGIEFALRLPQGEARFSALRQVMEEWSAQNPAEASAYAANVTGPSAEGMMRQTMGRWLESDPDAAFAWAKDLPAGANRDSALAESLRRLQELDPRNAMQLVEEIGDPHIRSNASREIITSLARTDPAAAVQWAGKFPEDTQPRVYHDLVRAWGFEDQQATGQWIDSLPACKARDSAVAAYVSVIDGMDAGAATRWAETISDPTQRVESLMSAFQRWLGEKPEAAEAWLQTANLAEGLRPFFEREAENRRKPENER